MKRTVLSVALACLALTAMSSLANAAMGGLGFHTSDAPIGVRHWFTDQVAGDLGVGFSTDKIENALIGPDGKTSTYTVEAGIPFCIAKYEKVHFLVRPGVLFSNTKDEPTGGTTVKFTQFDVKGELEVEYALTEKLSISASHGIAYRQVQDDQTPKFKDTGFFTTGNDFTTLGFHVYLW